MSISLTSIQKSKILEILEYKNSTKEYNTALLLHIIKFLSNICGEKIRFSGGYSDRFTPDSIVVVDGKLQICYPFSCNYIGGKEKGWIQYIITLFGENSFQNYRIINSLLENKLAILFYAVDLNRLLFKSSRGSFTNKEIYENTNAFVSNILIEDKLKNSLFFYIYRNLYNLSSSLSDQEELDAYFGNKKDLLEKIKKLESVEDSMIFTKMLLENKTIYSFLTKQKTVKKNDKQK